MVCTLKKKRIAFFAIVSVGKLSLIFLATVSAVGERARAFKSPCARRRDIGAGAFLRLSTNVTSFYM